MEVHNTEASISLAKSVGPALTEASWTTSYEFELGLCSAVSCVMDGATIRAEGVDERG